MLGSGFRTAAHERLPIVFVIMDNSEYAILKAFGTFLGTLNIPGLNLGGIDFVGLAIGYGFAYRAVESQDILASTLEEALASGGPSLVHVRIGPTVPPLLG